MLAWRSPRSRVRLQIEEATLSSEAARGFRSSEARVRGTDLDEIFLQPLEGLIAHSSSRAGSAGSEVAAGLASDAASRLPIRGFPSKGAAVARGNERQARVRMEPSQRRRRC